MNEEEGERDMGEEESKSDYDNVDDDGDADPLSSLSSSSCLPWASSSASHLFPETRRPEVGKSHLEVVHLSVHPLF